MFFFKGILENLCLENLQESLEEAKTIKMTANIWFHFYDIFEEYENQNVFAMFFTLFVENHLDQVSNNSQIIQCLEKCSEYCSDFKIREKVIGIKKNIFSKPKKENAFNLFLNQLQLENKAATEGNIFTLFKIFCAVKEIQVCLFNI